MASIPLPALHVNPPTDQGEGIQRMVQMMSMLRQQKAQDALLPGQVQQQQQALASGAMENQQKQIQLKDQQAMTNAMQEWDGKDINTLPGLMLKHGASAQTVMSTKTGIIKQQQDMENLSKDQLANQATVNDRLLGHIDAIKGITDPAQRGSVAQQQAQQIIQAGLHKNLDPQSAQMVQATAQGQMVPTDDQISSFEKGLTAHNAQIEQAAKAAETREKNAQAGKLETENEQLQKFGGLTPAAADAKYRYLQQQIAAKTPISPDDKNWITGYEKQRLLVPKTVGILRMEGMGKIKQFPVYDNQTKQTVYLDSNEINDAKLTEPGRYVVPQFSPEAITQQQTGKTFAPGGKGGEEALAFQTAIQHADLLKKAAQALNNGDTRTLNSLKNTLATEFGDADLTNFNAIKHVYENEVQKMIAGSHVTDAELKKNDASLPDNANFETTMKVLNSYQALAQSKLSLRQKQEQLGKKGQSMTSAGSQSGDNAAAPAPATSGGFDWTKFPKVNP